jgi:hypothetical protein
MFLTYYELGRMVVERKQSGNEHSKYGGSLLAELSLFSKNISSKGYEMEAV